MRILKIPCECSPLRNAIDHGEPRRLPMPMYGPRSMKPLPLDAVARHRFLSFWILYASKKKAVSSHRSPKRGNLLESLNILKQ